MKTVFGLIFICFIAISLHSQTTMVNYKLKKCGEKNFFMKFSEQNDSLDSTIYRGVNRKGNNVMFVTKDLKSRSGKMTWYHENGNIDCIGDFSNGKHHGAWKYYFDNNVICMIKKYVNNEVESITYFDENGNECCKGEKRDYFFPTFQDKPLISYRDYLQAELNKVNTDYSGSISLTFVVSKVGRPIKYKINNTTNEEISKVLFAILEKSPDFEPHLVHNRPEELMFTLTLNK